MIASCQDTQRLAEIDPEAMQVVESFTCCDSVDEAFDPFALAISPNGTVLAGTARIYEFDAATGGLVGLAIEAGVMGATSYYDYEFGPDGNLYVVANPNVGILVFDGVGLLNW